MLEYVNGTDKTLEFSLGGSSFGVIISGIAKGIAFIKTKEMTIKEIPFEDLPFEFKEYYYKNYEQWNILNLRH